MIDTFDSRALRRTDCYGQRFMRPGTYQYELLPAAWSPTATRFPYSIEVKAQQRGAQPIMQTHTVRVHADGNALRPDAESLSIAAGDLVLWNCPNAKDVPFAVIGEKDFFGNVSMVNECGFSHAFAAAGDYHWMDAHGSGLEGVVRVKEPRCQSSTEYREWQSALTQGTLVMISGAKPEPAQVEILTGQTVYFAVIKSEGISVTDSRLLVQHRDEQQPSR